MSQVYSRSVKLRGNVGAMFDGMSSFLAARGFTALINERPYSIVADRGMLRPTNKVQKYPHTLVLNFRPGSDSLTMTFTYIMSDFWHYTPGDQKYFDDEIDLFARGLVADGAKLEDGKQSVWSDTDYIDELRELAKLRDEGIITASDFEGKKRQLLGL